jgi:hypothetical protein
MLRSCTRASPIVSSQRSVFVQHAALKIPNSLEYTTFRLHPPQAKEFAVLIPAHFRVTGCIFPLDTVHPRCCENIQ